MFLLECFPVSQLSPRFTFRDLKRYKRDTCWGCNGSGGYIYCNPDNDDEECADYDAGYNPGGRSIFLVCSKAVFLLSCNAVFCPAAFPYAYNRGRYCCEFNKSRCCGGGGRKKRFVQLNRPETDFDVGDICDFMK